METSDLSNTRPRRPIAAMYRSPGPCYALPSLTGHHNHDPRSVHARGPAYPFGAPISTVNSVSSPGPVHFPDCKILRNGKDASPQFSIHSKPRDLTPFLTPGPAAYGVQSAMQLTGPKSPAFTFGARYRYIEMDSAPAPNVYSTPAMLGRTIESNKRQAPCYSMYGRSKTGGFHEDFQKTPGPGTYAAVPPDNYKHKLPQYSLTGRNEMPGDPTQKPGPGAHSPEKVNMSKHASPRYSFGIRHSDYVAPLIVDVAD